MSQDSLDLALFDPAVIDAETLALNRTIVAMLADAPDWWVVGAPQVRAARAEGRGPFPLAPKSPRAETVTIDCPAGPLALRVIKPMGSPRGAYLHIHGGGWVLGAADQQDLMLEALADRLGLVAISVDYRLAPEHPYPAAVQDCLAAAHWLLERGGELYATTRFLIGGESAGAHLAALTLLDLRAERGTTGFHGANLVFGCFDMGMTPSAKAFGDERLILRTIDIVRFREAFLPGCENFRDPKISPLYADLSGLPPALFTIGTRDALLDDSLFMHSRYRAAGNRSDLAVYPGGAHGFVAFPGSLAQRAIARCHAFMDDLLG